MGPRKQPEKGPPCGSGHRPSCSAAPITFRGQPLLSHWEQRRAPLSLCRATTSQRQRPSLREASGCPPAGPVDGVLGQGGGAQAGTS
ncbi:hypothetical protein NDU88_001653 [Pleurodeles waltl]|uniref:Uncharacterized protein n=1 Tax=Pleurodeles waltl TaxID=8319 RepID=A0AAV7KQ08_PLEWA|nr:hypothetical protein NDU88_001653 [Pleurodeles waltl]